MNLVVINSTDQWDYPANRRKDELIMTSRKRTSGRVISVQYVHDPEAAKKWMELLMNITKENFKKDCLHRHRNKSNFD